MPAYVHIKKLRAIIAKVAQMENNDTNTALIQEESMSILDLVSKIEQHTGIKEEFDKIELKWIDRKYTQGLTTTRMMNIVDNIEKLYTPESVERLGYMLGYCKELRETVAGMQKFYEMNKPYNIVTA